MAFDKQGRVLRRIMRWRGYVNTRLKSCPKTVALIVCSWFVANDACAFCPFCTATGLPFRQRYEFADVVGLASLESVTADENGGIGLFKFIETFKERGLQPRQEIQTAYFGPNEPNKRYLLQGVEPPDFIWDLPSPISDEAQSYIRAVLKLPDDSSKRLVFFSKHLSSNDTFIATDVYDEFALAPFEEIQAISKDLDRTQIRQWLDAPSCSTQRKQLYFMLLSVCGNNDDADWMEAKLRGNDPSDLQGLDALIASYLMLEGEQGLDLVNNLFVADQNRQFKEVFAALAALRFHASDVKRIESTAIADHLAAFLDRADIADLVVSDLMRIGDCRHVDRMRSLYDLSHLNQQLSIRTPIVNYLRCCNSKQAEELLAEIEKRDPDTIRRAKAQFPLIPKMKVVAEKPDQP